MAVQPPGVLDATIYRDRSGTARAGLERQPERGLRALDRAPAASRLFARTRYRAMSFLVQRRAIAPFVAAGGCATSATELALPGHGRGDLGLVVECATGSVDVFDTNVVRGGRRNARILLGLRPGQGRHRPRARGAVLQRDPEENRLKAAAGDLKKISRQRFQTHSPDA
ncbi:MAG: hypothetical protein QM740_21100 [Acidovorax sp.]